MQINNNSLCISTNTSSREMLLKVNAELIENLRSRVNQKRFKPQVGDSIRLGYYRALIQALQAHDNILKDVELDDLKKELEELKEALKCRGRE
jgi:TfoX/Sxy family transcriptional regulator of competence genes